MMLPIPLAKLNDFFKPAMGLDDYLRDFFQNLLKEAGVRINGRNPWDIQIHHPLFYRRVFLWGSLGLGEAYMEGWWDAKNLEQLFFRVLKAGIPEKFKSGLGAKTLGVLSRFVNFQTKKRSYGAVGRHYDLGNRLYRSMLDSRLMYSCGYWKNASDLEEAQKNKLTLTCEKLLLKPGMKLLDIGCGWGGLAKFAAEHYGVTVTGITNSKEQWSFAKKICKGYPIKIERMDYRDIRGKYDRVVSIGMLEHVGYKNYPVFMRTVFDCLEDQGLFLLHTIGNNVSSFCNDEWMDKYIFRDSVLPSARQLTDAWEELFVLEDWHNFGTDYCKTLLSWHDNFKKNWPGIAADYGRRFYRMWTYYLLVCAASFHARRSQLWQIVLAKGGMPEGYTAPR